MRFDFFSRFPVRRIISRSADFHFPEFKSPHSDDVFLCADYNANTHDLRSLSDSV